MLEREKVNEYEENLRKQRVKDVLRRKRELEEKLQSLETDLNILKGGDPEEQAVAERGRHRSQKVLHRTSFDDGTMSEGEYPESPKINDRQTERSPDEQFKEILRRKKEREELKKRRANEAMHKERDEWERALEIYKQRREAQKAEKEEKIKVHFDKLDKRNKQRLAEIEETNKKFKEVLKQKPLYIEKLEQFKDKVVMHELEERKKQIAKIREFMKPIDRAEIDEHDRKFEEYLRSKERERKKAYGTVAASVEYYKPMYEGKFYKSVEVEMEKVKRLEEEKSEQRRLLHEKKNKYAELVKEQYFPAIDYRREQELREQIERITKAKHDEEEEDAYSKGLGYLEHAKKLARKRRASSIEPVSGDTLPPKEGGSTLPPEAIKEVNEEDKDKGEHKDGEGKETIVPASATTKSAAKASLGLTDGKETLASTKGGAPKSTRNAPISEMNFNKRDAADVKPGSESMNVFKPVKRVNYMKQVREKLDLKADPTEEWKKIIKDKDLDEEEKRMRIKIEAGKLEQIASRKEKLAKYGGKARANEAEVVDDMYINAIKAKLALISEV
eukprot:TRINITY_DN11183_c0_g1_i1.p1 TRINITY_DN11183_c0_g1~~TRINITY_DN11183_c0_g1_i1.p1  ORF type:complete len:559 (+),score=185.44 TRINITY_DN11183_c0_g1_i1:451-2127(+)